MPSSSTTACMILLTFLGTSLAAEEIAIPLPKDGAWARYHVTTTHEADTRNQTSTRNETIKFVGTAVSDGVRHRWIEQSFGGFEDRTTNVMKTLVAEKVLNSAWPLAAERRWWHKMGDQPVKEVGTLGPEYGVFSLVFPGSYNTAKPLKEARTIEYQHGRLEIQEGLAGRQDISLQNNAENIRFEIEYKVWRHPNVPLGIAAAKISLRTHEFGSLNPRETYTTEFALEDCGTDAKTSLPEKN